MNNASWQAKAIGCELISFSLHYPTTQLAEAIVSGEWLDAAYEIAAVEKIRLPEQFGTENLASNAAGKNVPDADELLHVLRAEATRLFVGAPNPIVSPYEGVWRAKVDGVQALLFVNPHSQDVERFCKLCGLGRLEGTNEPLDHIATELELMSYLAQLVGGAEPLEAATPAEELPGGSAAAAFERFGSEHLLIWAPEFAVALAERTVLPFYRTLASLLSAYCSCL